MFEKVVIVFKPVSECITLAQEYYNELRKRGVRVDVLWVDEVKPGRLDDYELIISIGGDGTLLRISWSTKDRPVLVLPVPCGRRTIFYEDINKIPASNVIDRVMNGNFYIDRIEKIAACIDNNEFHALNEITILTQDFGKVLVTEVNILSPFIESSFIIEGDGVIVSTAAGSSAYALSVGASMIEPGLSGILFTPVNSMNLNMVPIFLHPYSKIFIRPRGGTNVYIDGIFIKSLKPKTLVKIYKLDKFMRIIRIGFRRDLVKKVLGTRTTLFK